MTDVKTELMKQVYGGKKTSQIEALKRALSVALRIVGEVEGYEAEKAYIYYLVNNGEPDTGFIKLGDAQ